MATNRVERDTRASVHQPRVLKRKRQQKPDNPKNTKERKELVVTQEIKLARHLAGNDKKVRDKVLKYLKKWLTARANSSFAFTETDFLRLWKGLFYCMWMSDKPLIQEELAEALSKLVHSFSTKDVVFLYTRCALQTLATEWFGIDQYRLDKFCMLVRRIVRQTFQVCKDKSNWSMDWVQELSWIINKLLLCPKTCVGFSMHITELFLEELAKVSDGDIPKEIVTELIKPYVALLIQLDDERQIRHIIKHIFRYLILQSDTGIEYTEKFNAWRQAGFPMGHIDAIEMVEDPAAVADNASAESGEVSGGEENGGKFSSNEMQSSKERPLDPRAGRVDVELPQVPFDPKQIADLLAQNKLSSSATAKSRRQILHLIKEFQELSEGKMPLGIKEITVPDKKRGRNNTKAAALRLLKLESELHSDNPPNKRKRKRSKRSLEDDALSQDSADELTSNESENEEMDEEIDWEDNSLSESDSLHEGFSGELDNNELTANGEDEHASTKQKKSNSRKSKLRNLEAISGQELSGISSVNVKKNREKKKNQMSTFCEMDVEENGAKQTALANINSADTNANTKQSDFTVTNLSELTAPVKKRRKLAKGIVCGSWDVSENLKLPTPSLAANSDLIPETITTPNKNLPEVVPDDETSNENAWLLSVYNKLNDKKSLQAKLNTVKEQRKVDAEQALKKRVKIMLHRNTAQHTSEYIQKVRQSPGIPFDADKRPSAGVLKASPIPSPINPFYKKSFK